MLVLMTPFVEVHQKYLLRYDRQCRLEEVGGDPVLQAA